MRMQQVISRRKEIEYRISRLETLISQKKDKTFAIYGVGINAKRCLDRLGEEHFIGLVDSNSTGRYIYGKKVLSNDEILLLGVDAIIIAAEPVPTFIVYERIYDFCLHNKIDIFDMYGNNLLQANRYIKQCELNYDKLTISNVSEIIANKKHIFVAFHNVLCSLDCDDNNILIQTQKSLDEKGVPTYGFVDMRIKAKNKVSGRQKNKLDIIYDFFTVMNDINPSLSSTYLETECEVIRSNSYPREKVVKLLKSAEENGANIYICCDVMGCEKTIDWVMNEYGVSQYDLISLNNDIDISDIYMTLHSIVDIDGNDSVLFIGNQSAQLMAAISYNVDIVYIKSAEQLFYNYFSQSEAMCHLSEQEKILLYRELNSPFVEDIDKNNSLLSSFSYKDAIGEKGIKNDLMLLPEIESSTGSFDALSFPKFDNVKVSIVIPVYNQFTYTYNCLKSILMNSEGVSYEIIVADDCSTDSTVKLDKFVSGINIIHNENNLRFLLNCNNAAKYAKGEYILFLNNDTQVQKNWLKPLLKIFEMYDDAGMVGSKFLYPDGTLQEAGGIVWNDAGAMNYGRGGWPNSCEYNYVREVDYISGASIIIQKKLWEDIGGFDERYSPAYCEDTDLAFEVRKRGKKVYYQPESEVIHFEGMSNGKDTSTGIKSYQVINQSKFKEKWKLELIKSQCSFGDKSISAYDRKLDRKCILVISYSLPAYDRDAGSRTIMMYIEEFLKKNYIVKYIPNTFKSDEPYSYILRQMGVEVFSGEYFRRNIKRWIAENAKDIDFAFINYPEASYNYIDVLKSNGIKTIYYGMDLHYVRLRREYSLSEEVEKQDEINKIYNIEKYVIDNSDVVYYPSVEEVNIVKKEFAKENVKCLPVFMYDIEDKSNTYDPKNRDGILFVGGFSHRPNSDGVIWFLNYIYDKFFNMTGANFYIIGSNMPSEIKNTKRPGLTCLGTVSDKKLDEMYSKVKVVIAPLRFGAGIKGKVIEAMYKGIPVVTTSIGAEGIPNENSSLIIADDENEFAEKLIDVYKDDNRLQKISSDFKSLIEKYFSREAAWETIKEDFE